LTFLQQRILIYTELEGKSACLPVPFSVEYYVQPGIVIIVWSELLVVWIVVQLCLSSALGMRKTY
jgi:hypothetical protein